MPDTTLLPVTDADRRLFNALFHIPERRQGEVIAGTQDETVEMQSLARHRLSTHPDHDALVEENARLREVPLVFYDSNDPARCAATLAHALERGHGRVSIVGWRQLIADLNAALATGEA